MMKLNRNYWRVAGWSLVLGLMLLPLIAMQFSDGVDWTPGDFIVAGVLLGSTGLMIELGVRLSASLSYRLGIIMATLTSLLLLWINLAVGVIGPEDNPINGLYSLLVAMVLIAALLLRGRANGLRNLFIATAIAQMTVVLTALLLSAVPLLLPVVVLNIAFALLWLIAAGLFHHACGAHN